MFTKQSLLENILFFGCLAFASYFTIIQLFTYAKNEDMSIVSHRQFNSEPENRYPAFTICYLSGIDGIFKKTSSVWNSSGITPRTYGKILRGTFQTKLKHHDIRKNKNSRICARFLILPRGSGSRLK